MMTLRSSLIYIIVFLVYYLLSFVGAAPGLFLAFALLGHKTSSRKRGFRFNVLIAAFAAFICKYCAFKYL